MSYIELKKDLKVTVNKTIDNVKLKNIMDNIYSTESVKHIINNK